MKPVLKVGEAERHTERRFDFTCYMRNDVFCLQEHSEIDHQIKDCVLPVCIVLRCSSSRCTVSLTSMCIVVYLCVRYEKQLQEEELSLQQQRRRLYKEVADEKERLAQLAER